ncbi:TetR/AcrR family transcriptional regulator [Methylobacillus gramineus]|uniref:TetR/AcrR family transcriptional regulator n=1 Tax=Methylobacillus gramineus TaxID=755169 RepID=UPI001CFFDED6|nr:TetR/AcrR family transcriptional regulator [Methylobacillus gramineus]MCB5185272.1 TetR/AcrR family transcriptional regulator [Methylobacillus gramineus]
MSEIKRGRGRPSKFDAETSLQVAMHLFWSHGYEGTSMTELTEAMSINKPSLYAAFGSKENLFHKAVEHYLAGPVAFIDAALQEKTAYEVVEKLLLDSAACLVHPDNPKGCMVLMGSLNCGKEAEAIKQEMIVRRQDYEQALKQRFILAQEQGDLSQDAAVDTLAKYVVTMHQGMSVQAVNGASRAELESLANLVLQHWPVNQQSANQTAS